MRVRCAGEGLERLEAFADGVSVGELVLVRQHFPIGKIFRRRVDVHQPEPSFQILLERFLKLERVDDEHDSSAGLPAKRRAEVRPAGVIHSRAGQSTARRKATGQLLTGRRCGNAVE